MVIEGRAVPYGRAAVALLADRVQAAKAGDRLAPVTVVVPSNYAAVAARRALAARPGGVANVTFVTLHRLAERLGAARLAAAGRLPVSVPVLAEAVRAVLEEEPGVFEPVADHPATEQALVRATQELAGVPDAALDDVAACSDRSRDVVRIARTTRARLSTAWHDEQDLLEAAAAALRDGTSPVVGPVVLHLLQGVSTGGAELLRTLAETGPVEALVGVTADAAADAPVLAAHERAGITVAIDDGQEPCCARRIVSASDPDDELRSVVRQVAAWMRQDVPLGRIALLYGTADPYRRLLHEHLAAAGIPVNGSPVTAVGDQLLGRTVLALLALPDRDFRRSDVLAVLTGAPVLAGDGRAPSRAWERVSRMAGVVGGADWDLRLATFADQQRERAAEADRDEEQQARDDFRRDADRADQLASFVRDLRAAVDRGATLDRWSDLATWTADLAELYLGGEGARAHWPEHERLAAERVEQAIERLASLDGVGGPAPTVEGFRRTLEQELESAVRRVGRLGDGVLVGHVSVATGLVLDRVVVLGLAEGVFPPRRLEDSLLPDAERGAAAGELPLRVDRLHEDRRHLLASVAAADEAVLSAPRGDLRRSGERPASRWLLADAARLAGADRLRSADLAGIAGRPDAGWLEHASSFAGALRDLALAATEQELRLAAVARGDPDHAVLGDPLVQAAAEVVRERRSDRFTRFDGNLAGVVGPEVLTRRFSATRLQTWAACPHRYLLQYVLRVEPVEEPERRLAIDALATGSLVHEVLDRFVREAVDCGHPLDRWGPADERRLLVIAEECFASYEAMGLTGRALLWRRDRQRILTDLRTFLAEDGKRLAAGIRPLRTELEFDDLKVTLPDGTTITVAGAIDRVDRGVDGSLVVLDYKTGSDTRFKDLSDAEPHLHGTKLQPYLYAKAAAEVLPSEGPVWAGYWFTSDKGKFVCRGYDVTTNVAARVEDALGAITSGIAAGTFPARPNPKPGWGYVDCWYCTPDGLSAADRRREWEAKRHDPQVRAYAGFAEPEEGHGGS